MGRHSIWLLVLCCLAAFGLVGCKGDNAPFRGETQFTGAWVGNWSVAGTNDSGLMTLTVAENSTMIGSFTNFGTGETGIVRGATHPDGLFNASFTLDGSGTVVNITGAMALDGGERDGLSGDGIWMRPGTANRGFTFDLDQDGPVASPFAGPFSGPWSVTGTTDKGTMTLTIGTNGRMAGTYTNTGNGTAGRVEGNVTTDGVFVGAFVENVTGTRFEIEGVLTRMADGGLAGDGTYTAAGGTPQGLTFTFPAPTGGDT